MNDIIHNIKKNRGNVFLLVLIIGVVVIFTMTAMIQFLFRDIGFVELDEGNLKALNIAEAGLSNWYLKFDRFSNGMDPSFQFDDSYIENVYEDGNIIGSFQVDYSPDIQQEWQFTPFGYAVISKGTDSESGRERTVRVRVVSLNLYDFIFSEEAMGSAQIAGQTLITGPLFVVGNLDMIIGSSAIKEGPLFVLGDITVTGSSTIGTADWPILLFMGGKMYEYNGPEIDPMNPPHNVEVFVDEFHNVMVEINLPEIDDEYLDMVRGLDTLEITGDLTIGNRVLKINGVDASAQLAGYLEFIDGILYINGNVIVNGNINIGKSTGPKYTIRYSGHSNLISTGNINVGSRVIPDQWYDFPESSLMTLISQQDVMLDTTNAQGGSGENDPHFAGMIISNNEVELSTKAVLNGSTVSHTLMLGLNSEIYYRYGIGEFLGPAVPQFNNILLVYSWQEIIDS